jgi:hypothetical protein
VSCRVMRTVAVPMSMSRRRSATSSPQRSPAKQASRTRVDLTEREMIGGLLRFAPGLLGARQDRAPGVCEFRCWVGSWLPCVTPGDELGIPTPREAGRAGAVWAGMATGGAQVARSVSRGWLGEGRLPDCLRMLTSNYGGLDRAMVV